MKKKLQSELKFFFYLFFFVWDPSLHKVNGWIDRSIVPGRGSNLRLESPTTILILINHRFPFTFHFHLAKYKATISFRIFILNEFQFIYRN